MGPPIYYYGDMSMTEDQDKNNQDFDLEKFIADIVSEVMSDWEEDDGEEGKEQEEE